LKTADGGTDGVTGADKLCQGLADLHMLGGTWMAFLFADMSNPINRFTGSGPWQFMTGQVVFADKAALSGSPAVAINIDETGQSVSGPVWTGNTSQPFLTGNCNNWGSGSGLFSGVAGDSTSTSAWAASTDPSCDTMAHLYCFEQ
jgi:hypothetical protein